MSVEEILKEFPKFESEDIYEVSSFVAEAMWKSGLFHFQRQ
jgi:uncharacterized protein (DUF433 family)